MIDKGQIIEEGNHESLIHIRGLYYDLVEAQKLQVEEEQYKGPANATTALLNQADDEQKTDGLVVVNRNLPTSSAIDRDVQEKKVIKRGVNVWKNRIINHCYRRKNLVQLYLYF